MSTPIVSKPQYMRSERRLGHFYRRFVLPDTVDSEKVNATGKNANPALQAFFPMS